MCVTAEWIPLALASVRVFVVYASLSLVDLDAMRYHVFVCFLFAQWVFVFVWYG